MIPVLRWGASTVSFRVALMAYLNFLRAFLDPEITIILLDSCIKAGPQ